jgi:hypothetical protein
VEGELDEELRFHLERQVEKYIQTGLTREESTRRTRLEFGGLNQVKEDCREARGVTFMETLGQDMRFGLRMLRRSPGFTSVAVFTLALGIGANAVVFSVLNALVLRPVNVPQGQKLYEIERGKDRAPSNSYLDYIDLRDRNRSFDGLVAYEMAPAGLDINGNPSPIWLYEASGNYFDELRIQLYLGRFFHSTDEHGPNSAPYIVLSYGYWQSHFHGDRNAAGRVVRLNKYSYTILGVIAAMFPSGTLSAAIN